MKNYILLFIFSFFVFISEAQTKSVDSSKGHHLKGKIINKVNLGAGCGYLKLASVIEFEIIEFTDQTYKQKEIGIIFRCPEFYGENFFEVGKVYEMNVEYEVENEIQKDFDFQVQNIDVLEKYKLPINYWALGVKKI
ncbi:MAG: hypothetical protein ABI576_04410 [Flavobacterium sp.]